MGDSQDERENLQMNNIKESADFSSQTPVEFMISYVNSLKSNMEGGKKEVLSKKLEGESLENEHTAPEGSSTLRRPRKAHLKPKATGISFSHK